MNDLLIKIYNYPLGNVRKMTIRSRCLIQKDIIEILKYKSLEGVDRENMQHHHDKFIDDILQMVSLTEMDIATNAATIMMATDRIMKDVKEMSK